MKLSLIAVLMFGSLTLLSQNIKGPEPFSEARKAIYSVEHAQERRDSLRHCYQGRWTLNFTYGQRFISPNNKTNAFDSVTLTDFTGKRGFYGLGTQYFVSRKVLVGVGFEFLFLPKKQEVTSLTGSGGNGKGSGGLMFSTNLYAKCFVKEWKNTRLYVGLALGRDQLIAKGGKIEFSFLSGRDEEIAQLNKDVLSANLSTSLSHRMALGSLIDFNVGYSYTTQTEPIGGITSPGGIKASISLQFVLNPQKNRHD